MLWVYTMTKKDVTHLAYLLYCEYLNKWPGKIITGIIKWCFLLKTVDVSSSLKGASEWQTYSFYDSKTKKPTQI